MRQDYADVVQEIYERHKFRGKISLEPIRSLMEDLGRPEMDFPAVHVAGTNGKGSTATMLAEVLEIEGMETGLFTSPHLVDFRERIRVDGEKISRADVVETYRRVDGSGVDTSFFECMTGMAFDHFSRQGVDIAVVETGMGGRLDATNVVEPELSVITNVAEEHTKWLGETPEQVAYEVAGIIKEGVPVVSGAAGRPAEVIAAVADEQGAELVGVGQEAAQIPGEDLDLLVDWKGEPVDTGLVGNYQLDNINTVLSVCDAIGRDVSEASIRAALEKVRMPGRMEVAGRDPTMLLDGAHNPAAVERLAETLEDIDTGKTVVVTSILADKDYPAMLSMMEGFADLVILSEAGIDRAADPEDLDSCLESVDSEVARDIPGALDKAMASVSGEDTVLVTGSMYFVGDVKKVLRG